MHTLRVLTLATMCLALSSSIAFAEYTTVGGCGPRDHSRILEIKKDPQSGIEYAAKIQIPASAVAHPALVGVLVRNPGPYVISYLLVEATGEGAWSTNGKGLRTGFKGFGRDKKDEPKGRWKHYDDMSRGADVSTLVRFHPKASTAFSDLNWGGAQDPLIELIGCVQFDTIILPEEHGKLRLGLSFWQEGTLHTIPIDFRFE